VLQGGGRIRSGDVLLLAAIGVAGLGYTEGGILARQYGGWRVICWALVLALPVSVPVTIAAVIAEPARPVTAGAALGLAYVSLVSMCWASSPGTRGWPAAGWRASDGSSWRSRH
jgi:hypothetical protein